jgi:hypothetical protein
MGVGELLSFDAIKLAEQLSCIDFDMSQKIKPLDFAEYIWMKDQKLVALDDWVARFNQVSYWVGTEICTTPLLKNRIAVIEHFIKMLKVSRQCI